MMGPSRRRAAGGVVALRGGFYGGCEGVRVSRLSTGPATTAVGKREREGDRERKERERERERRPE